MKQVTINTIDKPDGNSLNDVLQWFCDSLGIFTSRDKEKSCFRVFIELLKSSKKDKSLSSDELAAKLGIVRGTVVHHLNRLIDSGFVEVSSNRYSLKTKNLKELVSNTKDEVCSTLSNLEKVAEELDKSL